MYNANDEEQKILDFWKKDKTFEKSVNERPEGKPYVFYDGPPFATGLPHYGHILASVIKDVVPRYWTMKGYRVRRRWGWDCHGLPIESLIEKELKISGKKDIEEKLGVDKFNEACRSKVLMFAGEWKKMVDRIGRWTEFDNSYKTMDPTYIESIWWGLKTIWDKGLIYEGMRVLMYCPHCETPVSKAEIAMDNSYKDVTEQSVIVKFKITDEKFLKKYGNKLPTSFVAWTTTPWSIPTTMGLAVGPDFDYVIIKVGEEQIICAEARLDYVVSHLPEGSSSVVKVVKGKVLAGLSYVHPFTEYLNHPEVVGNSGVYKTYATDYVRTEEGTGVVTINGAYGEIDYESAKKFKLPVIVNVRADGTYDESMGALAGFAVKPVQNPRAMDKAIAKLLEERGALWRRQEFTHSYPHCWRCDSPLIYKAISAWFINVQKVKARAIELNEKINWYPDHLKHGRFLNILETAPDWNISRNRYWATPLPFWKCAEQEIKKSRNQEIKTSCENVVCIGSVKELKEKALNFDEVFKTDKVSELDLHKHIVDKVKLKCEKCGGEMDRIPEVIDCWVESGSMPYAEFHYPFENKEVFEKRFPGQYIAEYINQTRAWFYYMHLMSTLLFDSNSFENCVTTGEIQNEKGEKLSKSKQNYPDPWIIIEKYGVDTLRYYLMTSPVMEAENLLFNEREIREVYNKVINILWNVVEFYKMYAGDQEIKKSRNQEIKTVNVLDEWILAKLQVLVKTVTEEMDKYNTVKAGRPIKDFIDELSTWYLRRSRDRFKQLTINNEQLTSDRDAALATLREVLATLSKLMAPFMPFVAEKIHQEIKKSKNQENKKTKNQDSGNCESVHLELWPEARELTHREQVVIKEMAEAKLVVELGLAARAEAKQKVRQPLAELRTNKGHLPHQLLQIIADELNVKTVNLAEAVAEAGWTEKKEGTTMVWLDTKLTDELKKEGMLREVIRAINQIRKEQMLTIGDKVAVAYATDDSVLKSVFVDYADEIMRSVLAISIKPGGDGIEVDLGGVKVRLLVEKK